MASKGVGVAACSSARASRARACSSRRAVPAKRSASSALRLARPLMVARVAPNDRALAKLSGLLLRFLLANTLVLASLLHPPTDRRLGSLSFRSSYAAGPLETLSISGSSERAVSCLLSNAAARALSQAYLEPEA